MKNNIIQRELPICMEEIRSSINRINECFEILFPAVEATYIVNNIELPNSGDGFDGIEWIDDNQDESNNCTDVLNSSTSIGIANVGVPYALVSIYMYVFCMLN